MRLRLLAAALIGCAFASVEGAFAQSAQQKLCEATPARPDDVVIAWEKWMRTGNLTPHGKSDAVAATDGTQQLEMWNRPVGEFTFEAVQ